MHQYKPDVEKTKPKREHKWLRKGILFLFGCLLITTACQSGPNETSSSALGKHETRSKAPFGHQTPKGSPYSHSKSIPQGHKTGRTNPVQRGQYGSKDTGSKDTSSGLSTYYCSCLLFPSNDWSDQGEFYVCAKDPFDASSFSSLKCLHYGTQTCSACVCTPGVTCYVRGT